MSKAIDIFKISNPLIAQKNAYNYLGKDAHLYISNRKDKKYMIQDPNGKWINFGSFGYNKSNEDFTYHKDKIRRDSYINRAINIKGKWRENKYSPNNLSLKILWELN